MENKGRHNPSLDPVLDGEYNREPGSLGVWESGGLGVWGSGSLILFGLGRLRLQSRVRPSLNI